MSDGIATGRAEVAEELESRLSDGARVLTQREDRFVYSVEKWFDEFRAVDEERTLPDLVVRVTSNEDAETAKSVLEGAGYTVAFRNWMEGATLDAEGKVGLIDETDPWHLPADVDDQARPIDLPDLRFEHTRSADTFVQDRCEKHAICKGYCPINRTVYGDVETFSAKGRAIVARELTTDGDGSLDHSERVSNVLFSCATCGNCFRPCTGELTDMYEGLIEAKREIIESRDGVVPSSIRNALRRTFKHGNPYGEPQRKRADWTEDVDVEVPILEEGDETEVLLFVGCAPSYADRNRPIARSLARIFDAMGIEWGILGEDEQCAGNHQRALGEEGLFEYLVEENAAAIGSVEYDTLVTADPHSFHSFGTEYAEKGVDLDPVHYTQFLVDRLDPDPFDGDDREATRTVTYHDSCYLGTHNGVTAEPRTLLEWLPGYEFVDIDTRALCCGGGGGRMWFEDPEVGDRPSKPVVDMADEVDADVLAVACPFCATNMREATKRNGLEDEFDVRDISELVVGAVEERLAR